MYLTNYLYNPITSSLEPYYQINFNGKYILAPNNNFMDGVIELSGNLPQLIRSNTNVLFAISDYLITHRKEIKNANKSQEIMQSYYEINPTILLSFSDNKSNPVSIDLSEEISKFPLDTEERKSKILSNLRILQNDLSLDIADPAKYRNIFYCEENEQPYTILKILIAEGYLKPLDKNSKEYILTPEGKSLANAILNTRCKKTAFIAMSFSAQPHKDMPSDDLTQIRNAFKKAISKAGYMPIVIDEVMHNDYIPVEILLEIEKSSFLVQDLTYRNDGAIYEAGFAEGKGIPVIRCIRKTEFDNPQTTPHFDYRQKSMIIWTTYEELSEKLEKQIRGSIDIQ